MESVFFYIFAGIAVAAALGVVLLKNPVHSAVSLIVALLQIAALYILLRTPFLAGVQVFLYVGAVMVLFLFAVLLLDIGKERLQFHVHGQRWIAVAAVAVFFTVAAYLIATGGRAMPSAGEMPETTTEVLGKLLYTKYLFPFEVVSVLLLVALVGAIALVMKERKG